MKKVKMHVLVGVSCENQRKEYTIKIIATDEQIERIKRIVNEEE